MLNSYVLVDDDPAIRFLLADKLESLGLDKIGVYENGLGFIKCIEENVIENCLIVIDVHLPDILGTELINSLTISKSRNQVIILSSSKDILDEISNENKSFVSVCSKMEVLSELELYVD